MALGVGAGEAEPQLKGITGKYLVLSFTHHVDREIDYPAAPFPQIALPRGLGEGVGHDDARGVCGFVPESGPPVISRVWLQLSLNQREGNQVGTLSERRGCHLEAEPCPSRASSRRSIWKTM